ncbi:MAG: hypothetical protein U1D30_12300 [Planctomycetota bacterium]
MWRSQKFVILVFSLFPLVHSVSVTGEETVRVTLSLKSPQVGETAYYDDKSNTLRVRPLITATPRKTTEISLTVAVAVPDKAPKPNRITVKNPFTGETKDILVSGADVDLTLGTLPNTKSPYSIVAIAEFANGQTIESSPFHVIVDEEAPIIKDPKVDPTLKDKVRVTVDFGDNDVLPGTLVPANVILAPVEGSSNAAIRFAKAPVISDDRKTFFFEVATLPPATYNLSLKGVKDLVSNTEERSLVFTVNPDLEQLAEEAKKLSIQKPELDENLVQLPSDTTSKANVAAPRKDEDGAIRVARHPKNNRPEGSLDLGLKVGVMKGTTHFTISGVSLTREPGGLAEPFAHNYEQVANGDKLNIRMRLPANNALPVLYKISAKATFANSMVPNSPAVVTSEPFLVRVDERPPTPTSVTASSKADGSTEVIISLDDNDILDPLPAESFKLSKVALDATGSPTMVEVPAAAPPTIAEDRRSIRLTYLGVPPGVYTFVIEGKALTDILGNTNSTKGFELKVSAAPPPPAKITQTEFPEHVPRIMDNQEFNPGDTVDTRVIRLFYFRDAHRVVQIINRDVQQLNKLSFDNARIEANKARTSADEKTDARRLKELEAIDAASRAQELQAKLEDLQNQLAAELAKPQPTQAVVTDLQRQIASTTEKLASTETEAVKRQNELTSAQATEDRAREDQFRKEVAAGLADPDTYAKGKIDSVDPVLQVSLSVIGEGVIQARGPLRGIFKIARMIHQIDTPVGQVKVGIHTVQVNGENGNRMELVYEKIDKHLAQSRFLTTQSLEMFRKAVVMVADQVASQVDAGYLPPGAPAEVVVVPGSGLPPDLRAVRYGYAFFGPDFIRELAQMDSELLNAENKLLALNSMDTISLAGAIAMAALADHPIRQDIIHTFLSLVQSELPRIETDYYRALTRIRHSDRLVNAILVGHFQDKLDFKDMVRIEENARRTYQFSGLVNHMNTQLSGPGTLNSVQFATVRLAQALKAQLAAELELNNLRVERSLIETREGQIEEEAKKAKEAAAEAERAERDAGDAKSQVNDVFDLLIRSTMTRAIASLEQEVVKQKENCAATVKEMRVNDSEMETASLKAWNNWLQSAIPADSESRISDASKEKLDLNERMAIVESVGRLLAGLKSRFEAVDMNASLPLMRSALQEQYLQSLAAGPTANVTLANEMISSAQELLSITYDSVPGFNDANDRVKTIYGEICIKILNDISQQLADDGMVELRNGARRLRDGLRDVEATRKKSIEASENLLEKQEKLFAKRLLDQLIDEQEEKAVELLEAMRSHVSNIDNYLKRIATAIEDDVNAQFYNPAFLDIRRASRFWDVSLGQIETTTILTNNRTFAKVQPTATMEFDLPKRGIMIQEGMLGAKALVQDVGNLANDPTFLTAAAMLSGQPAAGVKGSLSPVQTVGGTQGFPPNPELGASLQALVPDPEVYKFETGTGFEIRPVIQPDGQSIVYSFDYMYTTNIREPVNANEKHLGRVKRHFVHTDVQTSSYELREVSRYTVALRAARTTKGVPLLEDIPAVGALFRPLPSAESSLQENIILASSVVYPTVYDLYGLRWSRYADAIASTRLAADKKNEQHRYHEMRNQILAITRKQVNERIGIPSTARMQEDPRALVAPPSMLNAPRFQRPQALLHEDDPQRGGMPNMSPHPGGLMEDVPAPGVETPQPGLPQVPQQAVPQAPQEGVPSTPRQLPSESHDVLTPTTEKIPPTARRTSVEVHPLQAPVQRTSYVPLTPLSPATLHEQRLGSQPLPVEPATSPSRRLVPRHESPGDGHSRDSQSSYFSKPSGDWKSMDANKNGAGKEVEQEVSEPARPKGLGSRVRNVFRSTRAKAN